MIKLNGLDLRGRSGWFFVACLSASVVWTSATSRLLASRWAWELEKINPVPMWLGQLVAIPMLMLVLRALFTLHRLDRATALRLTFYTAWFLTLFFGFAPGCMTEDTFYSLHMVRNGWWDGWYSPLHPALLTAFMQIVPWESGAPGLFLAMLWAVTFTAFHALLASLRAPKLLHMLLPLVLLLPAQVAGAIIVVRDSYFTALFLLFLAGLVHNLNATARQRDANLLAMAVLGAVLMIYRTDAVPAVAVGLAAMCLTRRRRQQGTRADALLIACPVILAFAFSFLVPKLLEHEGWVRGNMWGGRVENEYKLTLIENPLGHIVSSPRGAISTLEQAAIEKVFTFEDLKKYHCPDNLCLFYGGHWNKDASPADRSAAFRSALHVFASNPILFLESRMSSLDTVGNRNSQTVCSLKTMEQKGYPHFSVSGPLDLAGQAAVRWMQGTEMSDGLLGGREVWWNVYLFAFVALLIVAGSIWAPATGIAAFVLLLRTATVALAAPAGFSVYYLTLFIGVPLLLILGYAERRFRGGRRWRSASAHSANGQLGASE